MDTKSIHRKHPRKMKTSKDKDVAIPPLVVPPDLLKKFALNFVNGSQVMPADANCLPSTATINNEHIENVPASICIQKQSDTSILETASLMKKSVFLSPTFVSTIANAISGEVEISSKNVTEDSVVLTDLVEPQESLIEPANIIGVTNLLCNSNDIQEGRLKLDEYNIALKGERTSLLHGNEKQVVDINMTFGENVSKLESKVNNGLDADHSFKNESKVELTLSSTVTDSACSSSNDDPHDIPASKASKIKIISEETIPLSKLREIKILQSLNGKRLTPVTVQSIINTKIHIENGNSGQQSSMESNSTEPLVNTEKLHSDLNQVNSGENTNECNLKSMCTNEQIDATTVPSLVSSKQVEETRADITSKIIEHVNLLEDELSLKDTSKNITLSGESTDKGSNDFNEDNTTKAMGDYELNDPNKSSEDNLNISTVPNAKVNGFDRDEVVMIDVDKGVKISNCRMDEGTELGVEHIKKNRFAENEHERITRTYDNAEKVSPIPEATGIEEHSTVKENRKQKVSPIQETTGIEEHNTGKEYIKQKSNTKQSSHSKNTLDNDSGVKRLAEHIISSKNMEDKTLEHDELATILNATKKLSSSITDIKVDKVKEIAAYLRKFSHIYTDKKKTKTALSNAITKKETINTNTNTIESKLCIQGVEKPGGNVGKDREHTGECKVLKTYARRNPPKASKLSTHILHKNETSNTVDALDLDLDAVNISITCEMQEFCVCDDFGRLAYYDCDDLYEHIHFWHHHTAHCELDLIFAIYNDEAVISNSESGLEKEKTEETIETYNVCWSIHKNTIDHEMVGTAESKNSDSITIVEKPLNTDINDNNSDAGSEHINTGSSQTKLTLTSASKPGSSEISNALDKISLENCGAEDKTYQRRQSSSNEYKFSRKEVQLCSSKTANSTAKKRSLSGKTTPGSEPSFKKSVKCGLCNNIFSGMEWEHHVANQHHLIAWRAGDSIKLDDPELVQKLKDRLKTLGVLECSICNMQIKKFNRFMEHIKYCIRKKLSDGDKNTEKPPRKSRTAIDENFTCGVCQRTVLSSKWLEHIGSVHNYLAWKQGQNALNLENESEVWQHLQNIIRLNGSLVCYKCGLERSRVKTYQAHIKFCDGDGSRLYLDESSVSVDLDSSTIPEDNIAEASTVKCGVCVQDVAHSDWIEHICREHNYLAWQAGETPLNLEEEEAVWNHLQQFIRQNGGLTCHKCGLVRKRVKVYLAHVETCDGTHSQVDNSYNNMSCNATTRITDFNTSAESTENWYEVPIEQADRKILKCGVCGEEVPILEWIQHIGKEHGYLAWQDGAAPLNLENELEVKTHLLEVSKQGGGLVCNKCEKRLKYPKTFQLHIKECTGPTASPEKKLDTPTTSWIEMLSTNKLRDQVLTCGVCAMTIESDKWINHIEFEHQYLAWVEGQPPLNLEDAVMVQRHLNDVSKMTGGLMCMKCGVKRKYVKSYLLHVDSCQGKLSAGELSFTLMSKDIVECAVCAATMEPKDWRAHAMAEHYNIAWVVGDTPIEINNPYAVENYLKEYLHAHNRLVCKVCKISRASFVGFYAHIIVCGKTEKETEIYKTVCDICNNKYLRIYKNQHMTMHREKEYAKERKLLVAKEQALKQEADEPVDVIVTGRRKAAEKAKNVIEKYKSNFHDGNYHCSKCGFNSEVEKEVSDHVCVDDKWGDATDSDESVKLENCSGDDTDESDIDSNVSDEEREALEHAPSKKKKHSDASSAKICRLPYQINNLSTYMKRSTEGFIDTYLTDKDLFPLWHSCELEEVPENEVVNYMPPIEESCKVRFDENQDWATFNRLESSRVKDTIVLFSGASIQCMSWVPAAAEQERAAHDAQYLCVVAHRAEDAPRHAWDDTLSEPGLVQLWDCGNLIATSPKFVLGIAHDFGTVWAIDWCPSGARDVFTVTPTSGNMPRLGLMAVACSNGQGYIFVVPYPTSITEKEKPIYKLKPVAELRLTSKENRKVYQATAIKWSVQKGHSHVIVGYADGTTAYYDLNGESPLLKTTENNITVFYPYHDERVQNSCIEDVDLYPSTAGRAGGVVCVGSAGGAGGGALQSHVAAAKVLYPPHWPAALLAGDDCLVNQSINELEWWGAGRRLGGSSCAAGCAWCGRVCTAALPLLRLMRVHPCFPDVHKQVIGRIMMIPFGGKRKRQNDELAMIVEPITYSDAVKKYGIEFKQITARDRTTQQKLSATPRDAYPERFPLSDVAAIKFCPTFKQHHKLALAMHAGLIFIITV